MISRRALLITGGASVLVLGGGAAGLMAMSNIDEVREPWRAAEAGFGDVRLNALAYAILAPNPHNRQPWQIELKGDDAMTLYCDLNRLLPETDPPNRQITIGLGAFLELLRQASAEQGYRAEIDPFPEGEPYPNLDARPIAHYPIGSGRGSRTRSAVRYGPHTPDQSRTLRSGPPDLSRPLFTNVRACWCGVPRPPNQVRLLHRNVTDRLAEGSVHESVARGTAYTAHAS